MEGFMRKDEGIGEPHISSTKSFCARAKDTSLTEA
jgi:hypothetical protein